MSISAIETTNQNYAPSSTLSSDSKTSGFKVDSFQCEILDLERRFRDAKKEALENDMKGTILMSEKQWHCLMKKVDNAIDSYKDSLKAQEREEKKNMAEKKRGSNDAVTLII